MSFAHLAAVCAVGLIATTVVGPTEAATAATTESQPSPRGAPATAASQPAASDRAAPPGHAIPSDWATRKAPPKPPKKVDINNARADEIRTGLQVSDAVAKKIVEHRPYQSKGELVTKAGLPEGVYHAVRRSVEIQPPRKTAAVK